MNKTIFESFPLIASNNCAIKETKKIGHQYFLMARGRFHPERCSSACESPRKGYFSQLCCEFAYFLVYKYYSVP